MTVDTQAVPKIKSYISFVSLNLVNGELDLTVFSETPFVVVQVQDNDEVLEGTSLFIEVCLDKTSIKYTEDSKAHLDAALIQRYSGLKDFVRNNSMECGVLDKIETELNVELTNHLGFTEQVNSIARIAQAAHATFSSALKGLN